MKISVVVPTCLRDDLLLRCLDALATQHMSASDYEILVVDDGHSRTTRDLVERAARETSGPALRYMEPPRGLHGPAAARNTGWRAARGEIIAFTHDDTIPAPCWLREGSQAMDPDIGAAWGPVPESSSDAPAEATTGIDESQRAEFSTANCFVRRRALTDIDGFDERFKVAGREDADLYFTLLEHGFEVVHAPQAQVHQVVRDVPFGASLKKQRNMLFEALLFKKHPALYRSKISSRPPLRYYLAVFALFAGFELLLLREPRAAMTAFAIWLGCTLVLAFFRWQRTSHAPRRVLEMLITSAAIPLLAVVWRIAGAFRFRVIFA